MDVSLRAIWLAIFLVSCAKAPEAHKQEAPDVTVEQLYSSASYRLVGGFLENGWVVSRLPGGAPDHRGDSLIWTGLALGALPCDRAGSLEVALTTMIGNGQGALVRIEPNTDVGEVTLDGALGLYRGVALRITRCPESALLWAPVIEQHLAYVDAHGGHLHGDSEASLLVPEFGYLLDLLHSSLLRGTPPDGSRAAKLNREVAEWALAANVSHAACFRVHLGLLALQMEETLGVNIPDNDRNAFCAATRGMDMPTVDFWCGRSDLKAWIAGYQPNQWEFRHQRCGSWESPDGNGDETPGLDYIVALTTAYQL